MTDYANASDLTSRAAAKAQHPEVDESAPAASETAPEAPESDVVFAQTPAEVQAQIENRAAGADEDVEYDGPEATEENTVESTAEDADAEGE